MPAFFGTFAVLLGLLLPPAASAQPSPEVGPQPAPLGIPVEIDAPEVVLAGGSFSITLVVPDSIADIVPPVLAPGPDAAPLEPRSLQLDADFGVMPKKP